MKFLSFFYKYFLEILFSIIIIFIVIISVLCSIDSIPINYGKSPLSYTQDSKNLTNIYDYLKDASSNHTVIVVLKDTLPQFNDTELIHSLEELGFSDINTLTDNSYHSFIGIISGGEIIHEEVGSDEMITYGTNINNHYVVAHSGTYNNGYSGEIYIDTIQYSLNISGINIVTVDLDNNELIDAVSYDIFDENKPIYQLDNGNIKKYN